MKYRFFTIAGILILLFSCASNNTILLDNISDADLSNLRYMETNMIRFSLSGDKSALTAAEDALVRLEEKNTANRQYLARLSCLKAEYLFYTQGTEAFKKIRELTDNAEKMNPHEERIYIVRAFLETDLDAKITLLEKASAMINSKRAYLELGSLYFAAGDYRKAVSAFDEGIMTNSEDYIYFFQDKRDLAWSLFQADMTSPDSAVLFESGDITIDDIVKIIWQETTLMSSLELTLEEGTYFQILNEGGFFLDPGALPDNMALRRDVAFFIAALIAEKQRNPVLMQETADYYSEMGWDSPIPDLIVLERYFSAAVLVIELDIMEMPDGEHFYPEKKVTSQDVLAIVKQLKKLFPAPAGVD